MADPPCDTNKELRTNTWSIYAQGGLSWANGVRYENIDAKSSYKQSPAVGGGIDFTIRPWVRIGADYIWSRYRREQRFSTINTQEMPVKTYGNYVMNTHSVKLGAQFNFMEFWPARKAQWFNIWIGTGVGGIFARGNEYGMWINNTMTENGTNKPIGSNTNINNDGTVTITGNVSTRNRHENFDKLFIPATLHIEADVSRRFTLGVKGEMDWLLNRKEVARSISSTLWQPFATTSYRVVRASCATITMASWLRSTTEPITCARRLTLKRHAPTVKLHSDRRLNSRTATCSASLMTARRVSRLQ